MDMPMMDGFSVLEWLRQQPGLQDLPVIVLTGSTFGRDIDRAYRLGANSVVVKPADFTLLFTALKGVAQSWLSLKTLPSGVGLSLLFG